MTTSPVKRLCHWGPVCVLAIIKLITWNMVHLLGMWWPPHTSLAAGLHGALFLGLAAGTMYFFLQSLLEGPGFVPLGWTPDNRKDIEFLQYCVECKGYKAPRSHHCRKCGYCVMKMDHHCPWINCCVGHENHRQFTLFLIFAVLGCLHAAIVMSICTVRGLPRMRPGPRPPVGVVLTLPTLMLTLLAIGLSIGVVLAVGALLYMQIRSILRNRTTIEDWIVEKAHARRVSRGEPPLRFPYALGWRRNLRALAQPGDGLRWELADGCGPYDLTKEQLQQKLEKRSRSRLYVCSRGYGGRWLPAAHPRACLAAPCSTEPRLPLRPGDRVTVTRHTRHWLYGERQCVGGRGPRGWLPRAVVAPLDELKDD